MKVDFMIIGAQKCGTTTLFDELNCHPELSGSKPKELHFFSKTKDWKKNLESYHMHFKQDMGIKYFEASTSYTFYPFRNLNIWDDLYDYNPEMKLIYLVRNPLDRIISCYMHIYMRGYSDDDMETEVRNRPLYLQVSKYATQITPFIEKFGIDKVMILDFDDLRMNRLSLLQNVAAFVGVDGVFFESLEAKHSNSSINEPKRHYKFDRLPLYLRVMKHVMPRLWYRKTHNIDRVFQQKPVMREELRQWVLNQLQLEIAELERLTDKDFQKWLN